MKYDVFAQRFNEAVASLLMMDASQINSIQYWVAAIAGFVVLLIVFIKVGERIEVANCDGFAGFVATVLGLIGLFAGIALLNIYVAPGLKLSHRTMQISFIVVASALLAVPMIKFWTRSAYIRTLLAWLFGLACVMVIAIMINVASGAVSGGERSFERGASHNRDVKELINSK